MSIVFKLVSSVSFYFFQCGYWENFNYLRGSLSISIGQRCVIG